MFRRAFRSYAMIRQPGHSLGRLARAGLLVREDLARRAGEETEYCEGYAETQPASA